MRLIDADALKALIDEGWGEGPFKTAFFEGIDGAPTIDPAEKSEYNYVDMFRLCNKVAQDIAERRKE